MLRDVSQRGHPPAINPTVLLAEEIAIQLIESYC